MARVASRLSAGRRDRVFTIEQRPATDTADSSSGEPTATWTTLVSGMPAARTGIQGWERFRSDQMTARFDDRWEINYRVDMDPDLVDVPKTRRLVYEGRTLDIVSAAIIGRKAGIELLTIASAGI